QLQGIAGGVEAEVVHGGERHALLAGQLLQARELEEAIGELVPEREPRQLLSLALRHPLVDAPGAGRIGIDDVERPSHRARVLVDGGGRPADEVDRHHVQGRYSVAREWERDLKPGGKEQAGDDVRSVETIDLAGRRIAD